MKVGRRKILFPSESGKYWTTLFNCKRHSNPHFGVGGVDGYLSRSLNERPEMQCPVLVFSLVNYYPSLNTL